MRTAVQLYTLRDADATLDDADLDVAGAHVGVDRVEDDLDDVIGTYRPLGCETIVVPFLDESCFEDVAAVDATARRLSNLAVRLGEHGLQLANHDHEFVPVDELSAFERLVGATSDRVGFEFDVGWAAVAGQDPVDLLRRFGDRISHVHVKDVDVDTGEPVDLGEGGVDVECCVRAARGADIEWLIFEHDRPADPLASVEAAAERLLTVH